SGVEPVLRHPDPAVRVRALQALPYVANATHSAVGDALLDAQPEVRAAAAVAAGKLRLADLSDALVSVLADPIGDVASAAAFALAVLPDGVSRLQHAVSSGNRRAAAVAFEALEKVTMGRMELV
ncbi:MAG: HEAT repeat domain-containing protein, partial [Thermoanaerobaculia bacterium]